ncbi:hypothetical protein F8M41_023711 [Gigaspora margarita]|uniref:Uncharacterized protein n=1 Tax=Gigaspora margarita TaxID=4874 RepID=A0A8H4B0P8_GIGMA|nr:hypothetical protein F8M41_023711 [Gigaspora margarita]
MYNQSEHTSVEMENKEKYHEVKYESVTEEDCPEGTRKYFAISPEGDFLVEFKVIGLDSPDLDFPVSDSPDSLEFELKMYNIKNLKNEDDLTFEKDSKQVNGSKRENETNRGDEQELSYNKFSRIHNDTKSPFGHALLYKKISSKDLQNTQNHGFTFVFIINNDYTIDYTEDKELLIKCGGMVKLFYEKDYIADQRYCDHFLILLTLSEIYKYHIKNKSTYSIQELKYPKRIYNSVICVATYYFKQKRDINDNLYNYVCTYIQQCINKHYFLVDTIREDIKYIELYDLKTNQLIEYFFFFHNDEKLLIYFPESNHSSAVWAVWNIFSSLSYSVKLNKQKFKLNFPSFNFNDSVEKSNSCIVVYLRDDKHDKLFIYDDLVVDKYFKNLKESDKQDWIIQDLEDHTQEFKIDKLYEPWILGEPKEEDILYSFYLDKKKEKLLIIRNHTVQLWYKGTLKFIHSPSPFIGVPHPSDVNFRKWYLKKIEVKGIEYCRENFKFSIQIKEDEEIKQIKMDGEDDVMNVAKYAYFDDFIEQTRKIIINFIRLYPTEWRLLNIRFDLMSTLVKTGEYKLVYYILSFGELPHIPQYLLWSDKENTSTMISIALSENYKIYAQKLFYSSCFCDKEFDLFSFEILEVTQKSLDLLKVYIPITQLIPQNSELVLQKIDYDKIGNIRMVPLMDFTMNKKCQILKKENLQIF